MDTVNTQVAAGGTAEQTVGQTVNVSVRGLTGELVVTSVPFPVTARVSEVRDRAAAALELDPLDLMLLLGDAELDTDPLLSTLDVASGSVLLSCVVTPFIITAMGILDSISDTMYLPSCAEREQMKAAERPALRERLGAEPTREARAAGAARLRDQVLSERPTWPREVASWVGVLSVCDHRLSRYYVFEQCCSFTGEDRTFFQAVREEGKLLYFSTCGFDDNVVFHFVDCEGEMARLMGLPDPQSYAGSVWYADLWDQVWDCEEPLTLRFWQAFMNGSEMRTGGWYDVGPTCICRNMTEFFRLMLWREDVPRVPDFPDASDLCAKWKRSALSGIRQRAELTVTLTSLEQVRAIKTDGGREVEIPPVVEVDTVALGDVDVRVGDVIVAINGVLCTCTYQLYYHHSAFDLCHTMTPPIVLTIYRP